MHKQNYQEAPGVKFKPKTTKNQHVRSPNCKFQTNLHKYSRYDTQYGTEDVPATYLQRNNMMAVSVQGGRSVFVPDFVLHTQLFFIIV